jgi:hypothetical protein
MELAPWKRGYGRLTAKVIFVSGYPEESLHPEDRREVEM